MAKTTNVVITEPSYWLTSVKSGIDATAEEVITDLVGGKKVFFFGDRTPGRSKMIAGDWICFYAAKKGIVAHAMMASSPEQTSDVKVRQFEEYTWIVRLENVEIYANNPTLFSADVIGKLNAFEGRAYIGNWNWFVQATHKVSRHDFGVLTGGRY